MTLVLVEVTEEALERLTQNADVRVVGILTKPELAAPAPPATPTPMPRKWAGSLSEADAASWDKHLTEIRNEWE
ncbi:MAG TPA: hypothetical protein VFO93_18410 [Hymenobacter sp.]|uniref:hypothetical protein n=1 Tax=Hymenobacter sp. TaxID=1898978 RepID=UPI002D7E1AFB|nr:hypothetical protein [Hymenobacter sp.]HET9505523.1 hypothetical protein [Hymenobacter sp.]